MSTDEKFMSRCIELAQRGLGDTYPNPLVGSVIVHENKIIGEGFHEQYGEAHAEVNAVNSVQNKSLLNQSTIYVTLEPCSHFGKTPPCADLIIKHQIPKVVIGIVDPFAKVSGEGIKKLKSKGIEVIINILKNECLELNKRFLWNVKTNLPYIILKWAETKDGFIDKERKSDEQKINWITSSSAKSITHTWRKQEAGILVGVNTIQTDNPELTVREIEGKSPIRIIFDPNSKLDEKKYKIFEVEGHNLIYTKSTTKTVGNSQFIAVEDFNLRSILLDLKKRNVSSILVEGGAFTINQFIKENLWNEARVYKSHKVNFKNGTSAPLLDENLILCQTQLESEDLVQYRNTN